MKPILDWMLAHRLLLGCVSLLLTVGYGIVLLSAGTEVATAVGIVYIAVIATLSLLLDIMGTIRR